MCIVARNERATKIDEIKTNLNVVKTITNADFTFALLRECVQFSVCLSFANRTPSPRMRCVLINLMLTFNNRVVCDLMSSVLLVIRHAKVTINKRATASGNDSIDLTVIFALFIRINLPFYSRHRLMAAPVSH